MKSESHEAVRMYVAGVSGADTELLLHAATITAIVIALVLAISVRVASKRKK